MSDLNGTGVGEVDRKGVLSSALRWNMSLPAHGQSCLHRALLKDCSMSAYLPLWSQAKFRWPLTQEQNLHSNLAVQYKWHLVSTFVHY